MHAIVRQGDGKYYVSPVFGYYKDVKSKDDYQRWKKHWKGRCAGDCLLFSQRA